MELAPATSLRSEPLASLLGAASPGSADRLGWLAQAREQARAAFLAHGLPTRQDENWRYTDLKRLRDNDFRLVTEAEAARSVTLPETLLPQSANRLRLAFVNGAYRADLSQTDAVPGGITVLSLAAAIAQGRLREVIERNLGGVADSNTSPMVALNTALFEDGVVIVAEPGLSEPVWIETVFAGGADVSVAYSPRHFVSIGAGSRLVLTEQHIGSGDAPYFANPVMQVDLQPGARLSHYRTVDSPRASSNTITTAVSVGDDATYENVSLIGGHGLNRIETRVALNGAGASCTVSAGYRATGNDLCDNTTLVEHLAPNTTSRQVFRGVIDDTAHAVFQGRVLVARGADGADGHQLSKALLLSDEAEIDQKPALEIFADNVKCSHGAAAGSLDKGALFYLRSRGLPEAIARRLLIEGFLAEALQEVSIDDVRVALRERAAATPIVRQDQS